MTPLAECPLIFVKPPTAALMGLARNTCDVSDKPMPVRWMFHLGSRHARRRLLRFVLAELKGALAGQADEAVWPRLVPGTGDTVRGRELYLAWRISQETLRTLIEEGHLQARTPARRGANGSPMIDRASALAFLQSRRQPTALWQPEVIQGGVR